MLRFWDLDLGYGMDVLRLYEAKELGVDQRQGIHDAMDAIWGAIRGSFSNV